MLLRKSKLNGYPLNHLLSELRLREEELHLYSHLDEENEHKILQGRLEYTQRRIIRLRDEKELLRLKSTIAHLEYVLCVF